VSELIVRIGQRVVTIDVGQKISDAEILLVESAAKIAAGIEAGTADNENWTTDDTVNRALDIATELLIAVVRR
jgi:hypothetical protein